MHSNFDVNFLFCKPKFEPKLDISVWISPSRATFVRIRIPSVLKFVLKYAVREIILNIGNNSLQ